MRRFWSSCPLLLSDTHNDKQPVVVLLSADMVPALLLEGSAIHVPDPFKSCNLKQKTQQWTSYTSLMASLHYGVHGLIACGARGNQV